MNDKITKIDIITRPEMLDELKAALNEIGVEGMTVSQVFGCGVQKGHKEIYRGRAYDINLLPKVKVETVVCEVPVEKVLNTAQEILCTGEHGGEAVHAEDPHDGGQRLSRDPHDAQHPRGAGRGHDPVLPR